MSKGEGLGDEIRKVLGGEVMHITYSTTGKRGDSRFCFDKMKSHWVVMSRGIT